MRKDLESKKRILGLTGMYCAGKNHIARILEARGWEVLDVDKLGHEAIEIERKVILERFGVSVLGADNSIDRKRLGEKVFGKPEDLAWLESIIHPAVNRLTDAWIENQGTNSCVINAALLHKASAFSRLDGIILVKAPFFTRLLRARKRDRLSWIQLIRRFRSQKEFTSQYLKEKADIYIVINKGYSGFCSRLFRRKLEDRIDDFFACRGW